MYIHYNDLSKPAALPDLDAYKWNYPLFIRPRSRFSTLGGTSPVTSPPKLKTSES